VLYLQPTELAHWHALVNEAQLKARHELGETLESYVVYLLMRFTQQPDISKTILAEDYLTAINSPRTNDGKLQSVGDKCLILSGLFPDRNRQKGLPAEYIPKLGKSAFFALHQQESNNPNPDTVFGQLAHQFETVTRVIDYLRQPCETL
jgi:hypothetical protein